MVLYMNKNTYEKCKDNFSKCDVRVIDNMDDNVILTVDDVVEPEFNTWQDVEKAREEGLIDGKRYIELMDMWGLI